MLVADGLTKTYRGDAVVRGVTLRVDPGRVVGLVGANGAGKTTTIKMLAGLVEPTGGRAELDGRPTTDPDARRAIGYLPEESPLYDDETPPGYLAFFASLYGMPRADARDRAHALLGRLALEPEAWKRPIGTLSKGQRRKVAIARCLLHRPGVLLWDEPTSGLDPLTMREVEAVIRELRGEGKALLLSAHNLPQVEELCDEILVMHRGAIVARGTLAELRGQLGTQRYHVRATVAFPGSAPDGAVHGAVYSSLADVERALAGVRDGRGIVLEVESVPPKLEEILRRAAEG